WYEYIFNPTIDDQQWWRFLPLQISAETLEDALSDPVLLAIYDNDPFDPDTLAHFQLGSYQKAIVMRYIDNLIQWGDALFARFTWENNTEATLLYVLANDLLGDEPQMVTDNGAVQSQTFPSLETHNPNGIPQFLIEAETIFSPAIYNADDPQQPFNFFQNDYYFCIGENKQFMQYWQIIDDRLYKLRHGLNIDGQAQLLPSYQEDIDINRLIGNSNSLFDSGTRLNTVPVVPYYRFDAILLIARNVANHVAQLGSMLLSTFEKQDAEQMSVMQVTQETNVLSLMTQVKQDQINQLTATQKSLASSLDNATLRQQTMDKWLQQGYSAYEITSLTFAGEATARLIAAGLIKAGSAAAAYMFPTIFGLANGGFNPGKAIEALAVGTEAASAASNQMSHIMATVGQYERREDDWALQRDLAANDVTQIQAQMEANDYALQAAQQDLVINQQSIVYARKVEAFVKTKFTNKELYQWMAARLSTMYSQTYQLALKLTKMVETAYQYELSNHQQFINPVGWDALKKGLLAGESLLFDLTQLEVAYKSNNVRKLEIEKTISLRQLDPEQWQQFRKTGNCTFSLNEQLFDFDYPGHYDRTIKTISLSIPAIVGPYQNIQATLTQTTNRVVLEPDIKGVKSLLPNDEQQDATALPTSIRSNWYANQQVAITRGINDDGLFVLNFGDERYVPFEGTGAISEWELSMPPASNPIDFNSITDVIIQLKYTATDGSKTLVEGDGSKTPVTFRDAVIEQLPDYSGYYYLSLSQAYPAAWRAFLNQSARELDFTVNRSLFPFNLQYTDSGLAVGSIDDMKVSRDKTIKGGQVALLPILAQDVDAQDKGNLHITLNDNQWRSEHNLALIQKGNSVPVPVEQGLAWKVIVNDTIPADLLTDPLNQASPIDGSKWLDIMLVIPFSGKLRW
ncbi:MAG: hypothetical protein JKY13_02490, partial [Gammaproteobacteria bacterium]|nr:hypothetical protein [Gammaproteobacteria bacterium]